MLATVALTWGGWNSGVPYRFPEWRHIDNANVMEPNVTASSAPKANTRVTQPQVYTVNAYTASSYMYLLLHLCQLNILQIKNMIYLCVSVK